jgi:hypothetical protein
MQPSETSKKTLSHYPYVTLKDPVNHCSKLNLKSDLEKLSKHLEFPIEDI